MVGELLILAMVAAAPSHDSCRIDRSGISAEQWLARAWEAMGVDRERGRILAYHATTGTEENYESDRTYPPFFSAFERREGWFDPATGLDRSRSQVIFPGASGGSSGFDRLTTGRATWMARDTAVRPAASIQLDAIAGRRLNPIAVVRDWRRDREAVVGGRCHYRDYERVVLERRDQGAGQRLFLDPKTGYPVKLELEEPHYLWGQVRVEYLWSTWIRVGQASLPGASFRLVDGAVENTSTLGQAQWVSADSAPARPVIDTALAMPSELPRFLQPLPVDTVRVSDRLFLLHNLGYREAVALVRDTVFLFDATQGDERARLDSAWIAKVFPGPHPLVLVVTDLAWPHVAGVRYWVSRGATVVSHAASRDFLERVVSRRWTRWPDALERARRPLRFVPVTDSLRLAGGDVILHPIDGIASEGALMGWLPSSRFLWASDYIQDLSQPTQYLTEVAAAASRARLSPLRFAAEHVPLTEWTTVERLR